MESATQQAPPANGGAQDGPPGLVAFREPKQVGMPTSGIMVLVSDPKSGKTTLAADAPGSYVLELDRGDADHVRGRIQDIENLDHLRNVLPVVVKEPSVQTVVVDTVDTLGAWIEDETARKYGLDKITDRQKGVDGFEVWGRYNEKMAGLFDYLNYCGKLVILTAHVKPPKLDTNGNITIPAGLNLRGAAAPYLAGRAKLIGYCYKRELGTGTGYYVTFKGGPLGQWGSRVDELNDKTLLLPRARPWSAIADVFREPAKAPERAGDKKDAGAQKAKAAPAGRK